MPIPTSPRWGDAPWTALDAVAGPARQPSRPPAMAPPGGRRRPRCCSCCAAGLPGELGFLLQELVRLARLYTELDDLEHYQTARLGPLLRRAVQALGASLAGRLPLAEPLDLFFAREDAAGAGDRRRRKPATWQALAHRGRRREARPRPAAGQSPPPGRSPTRRSRRSPRMPCTGIPGSPGRAAGPAYVVRSPDDFAACPPGAVLVVRATTPAWTALFARAAGIVAESGGPLSHGAIAAREYGIPAVMAVRGAMHAPDQRPGAAGGWQPGHHPMPLIPAAAAA